MISSKTRVVVLPVLATLPSLPHRRRRCRHRRRQRQAGNVGCSRVEPFVGCLFPWRNCHGGAWNKTLLITHTRVRIE